MYLSCRLVRVETGPVVPGEYSCWASSASQAAQLYLCISLYGFNSGAYSEIRVRGVKFEFFFGGEGGGNPI